VVHYEMLAGISMGRAWARSIVGGHHQGQSMGEVLTSQALRRTNHRGPHSSSFKTYKSPRSIPRSLQQKGECFYDLLCAKLDGASKKTLRGVWNRGGDAEMPVQGVLLLRPVVPEEGLEYPQAGVHRGARE
jgi:hypothetical protein